MKVTVDFKQLQQINLALSAANRKVSDQRVVGSALRRSLKPMLEASRRNAPVGEDGQNISLRTARRVMAKGGDVNAYRRGGATRADQRIKIVKGQGSEIARGLVGTDKRRGKVGYRTHLITRKNKHRRRADDFLGRAFNQTVNLSVGAYGQEMTKEVQRAMKLK